MRPEERRGNAALLPSAWSMRVCRQDGSLRRRCSYPRSRLRLERASSPSRASGSGSGRPSAGDSEAPSDAAACSESLGKTGAGGSGAGGSVGGRFRRWRFRGWRFLPWWLRRWVSRSRFWCWRFRRWRFLGGGSVGCDSATAGSGSLGDRLRLCRPLRPPRTARQHPADACVSGVRGPRVAGSTSNSRTVGAAGRRQDSERLLELIVVVRATESPALGFNHFFLPPPEYSTVRRRRTGSYLRCGPSLGGGHDPSRRCSLRPQSRLLQRPERKKRPPRIRGGLLSELRRRGRSVAVAEAHLITEELAQPKLERSSPWPQRGPTLLASPVATVLAVVVVTAPLLGDVRFSSSLSRSGDSTLVS